MTDLLTIYCNKIDFFVNFLYIYIQVKIDVDKTNMNVSHKKFHAFTIYLCYFNKKK